MNHYGRTPLDHAPHILYVNAIWSHHSIGTSGIVRLYDTITGEHKFYWGATSGGIDEWADIVYLSNHGHQFNRTFVKAWLDNDDNPFEGVEI